MVFEKYMHLDRWGNSSVRGIDMGKCFVFPKLDGTNASVWHDGVRVCAGSRNRHLSIKNDNAGFCEYVMNGIHGIERLLDTGRHLRLFGEWLVPHTIKTYRDDAEGKFYVFDVWDDIEKKFIPYNEYKDMLDYYLVDYVKPQCVINNPTNEYLLKEVENNTFLIKEGEGIGEGIVIKQYDYVNKFGDVKWAKMIKETFKSEVGIRQIECSPMVEQQIVTKYVTNHFVNKSYNKILVESDGEWESKFIPKLLGMVWYDLITEEIWDILKKMKNPEINFRTLNGMVIKSVKEINPGGIF